MNYYLDGSLSFEPALNDEQIKEVCKAIGIHEDDEGAVEICDFEIEFIGFIGKCSIFDNIERAAALCNQWGVNLDNSEIVYTGDGEGCITFKDGEVKYEAIGAHFLREATPAELWAALEEKMNKPILFTVGHDKIALTQEQAEAVHQYMRRENLKEDLVGELETMFYDGSDEFSRWHITEDEVFSAPIKDAILERYEKNQSASISAEGTWDDAILFVLQERLDKLNAAARKASAELEKADAEGQNR